MTQQPLAAAPAEFRNRSITLGRPLPAFPAASGDGQLGLMTRLPAGAEVNFGGPGFNEQTIRVRCGESDYYVFLEDLPSVRKPAGLAASAG